MISYLIPFVIFTLGIIVCASLFPLITIIKLKKTTQTKNMYLFSSELFEAEYYDTECWQYLNQQYETKKLEELGKQLP